MSIEKSIQNLIKAIQQPTRYMGDEPSIKVVPKPGNDPCAPLFTPSLEPRTDIAADTICKFLDGINSCSYLNEHNNNNCKPSDFFWRREDAHGKMPGAEILNAGHVDGICETYANSILEATNGLSEIQKIEIKRSAKCSCYKYALEGGPVITPPPTNGIQTIFPRHLQEQILRAFGGKCSVLQLRAMCTTLNSVRGVYLRKRGDQSGLGCQLSTTLST